MGLHPEIYLDSRCGWEREAWSVFVLLLGMIGKGKGSLGRKQLIETIEGIGKPNQRKIER